MCCAKILVGIEIPLLDADSHRFPRTFLLVLKDLLQFASYRVCPEGAKFIAPEFPFFLFDCQRATKVRLKIVRAKSPR